MTKLLFCGACGDVVSMSQHDNDPRWCNCLRHAAWWHNGQRGIIHVHDRLMPTRNGGAGGKAWIIGLHNSLLTFGGVVDDNTNKVTSKGAVEAILISTPDTYVFKRTHSLAIRFAPGYTGDSAWAEIVPSPVKET